MMDSENNYHKIPERELRKLIKNGDYKALDEFDRRIDIGEIERRTYTAQEVEQMILNKELAKKNNLA